jgi:putative nucleotidyltransferase with HDIG domain
MRDLTPDIERINEIVAFPLVLAEVQAEILKDNAASVRVAQLVEMDAALTVQVLRAANSPFYGLRWEVTSVPQAVAVLGFEEVGHLALFFHMRQQIFKLNEHQVDFLNALWQHSISTAIVAQALVTKIELRPFGKAFTAGLLHDIGKIVLAQYYPLYLDEIRQMTIDEGLNDIEVENQLVGTTHAEIGARLCEKWKLPADFIDVIRRHHNPSKSTRSALLTASVRFADLLCELWEIGIGEQRLTFDLEQESCWILLKEQVPRLRSMTLEQVCLDLAKDYEHRLDLLDLG